jgi:ankyrin repeat protein
MRQFAFIILFSSILFSISADENSWPFTSTYWKNVTLKELKNVIGDDIDIDAVNPGGYTALLYAAGLASDPEIISFLIENHADMEKQAGNKWTPLMFAISTNSNPEVSRRLIEGGADVRAVDGRGYTVLMTAARWNSSTDLIERLIQAGADVNRRNSLTHNTALMYAAGWNQNPSITELLVEKGSGIEIRDNLGRTAIMLSAELNQNPGVFFYLMSAGAETNKKDLEGRTLLMLASAGFNPEVVDSLYENGADIEAYDAAGLSVWDYISQNENMQGSDIFWKMNDLYYEGQWQVAPPIEAEPEKDSESIGEFETLPVLPSSEGSITESLLQFLSN